MASPILSAPTLAQLASGRQQLTSAVTASSPAPRLFSLRQAARPAGRGADSLVCHGKKSSGMGSLKSALSGTVDIGYRAGTDFLREELGYENQSEMARVLDIAMNPNSLFVTKRDRKRSFNASARPLDVEADMRPVADWMRELGYNETDMRKVISEHPAILSYDVETQLQKMADFLVEVGCESPAATLLKRPSILGLDVDNNMRRIVDYLQANDYTTEQIIEYIETSL